jgi:hypothetical protein
MSLNLYMNKIDLYFLIPRVALLGQLKNDSNASAFVQQRRYLDVIKRLRNENPNLSVAELERLAASWLFTEVPKSRAFYRIQAMRFHSNSNIKSTDFIPSNAGHPQNDRPRGHHNPAAAGTGRGGPGGGAASDAGQAQAGHSGIRPGGVLRARKRGHRGAAMHMRSVGQANAID